MQKLLKRKQHSDERLAEAARAVADFLSGPQDRLGRIDPAANDAARAARERVRDLAVRYGVTGSHTYIEQCAAVLRAGLSVAADDRTGETVVRSDDMSNLRWYLTNRNNGRGRLTGATARLAKAGMIAVQPTGYYTWVAKITDKGREALRATQPNS